jgi:hypothetical protein
VVSGLESNLEMDTYLHAVGRNRSNTCAQPLGPVRTPHPVGRSHHSSLPHQVRHERIARQAFQLPTLAVVGTANTSGADAHRTGEGRGSKAAAARGQPAIQPNSVGEEGGGQSNR